LNEWINQSLNPGRSPLALDDYLVVKARPLVVLIQLLGGIDELELKRVERRADLVLVVTKSRLSRICWPSSLIMKS